MDDTEIERVAGILHQAQTAVDAVGLDPELRPAAFAAAVELLAHPQIRVEREGLVVEWPMPTAAKLQATGHLGVFDEDPPLAEGEVPNPGRRFER